MAFQNKSMNVLPINWGGNFRLISKYLFLCIILFACKSEKAEKKYEERTQEVSTELIEQPADVLLLCKEVATSAEEAEMPSYEVFFQLSESKVKVADILNCETITPDLYKQYQIPKNAISAVGGWWAGAGDYLYIIEEDGNYVIKKGDMDEARETDDYHYKTIVQYTKAGEEVYE
ncbi:MAG: hypothetical protein AAFZ15_22690 [Bacteroidota bacterium]